MRPGDVGMLAGRVLAHGRASALVGDGPKLRANGRAVIVDPEGDPRRDTPGNPYGYSADALRCMREASPSAIAPDAWPARPEAWAGLPCTGMFSNGMPYGANFAGPMHDGGRWPAGQGWRS